MDASKNTRQYKEFRHSCKEADEEQRILLDLEPATG